MKPTPFFLYLAGISLVIQSCQQTAKGIAKIALSSGTKAATTHAIESYTYRQTSTMIKSQVPRYSVTSTGQYVIPKTYNYNYTTGSLKQELSYIDDEIKNITVPEWYTPKNSYTKPKYTQTSLHNNSSKNILQQFQKNGDETTQKITSFMETEVVKNPLTGETRSNSWSINQRNKVIHINEKSAYAYNEEGSQRSFQYLFDYLQTKAEFAACLEMDTEGHISISLTGKLEAGVPFVIKYTPGDELEIEAELVGTLKDSPVKDVNLRAVYKIPIKSYRNDAWEKVKIRTAICYPFRETRIEVITPDGTIVCSPRQISFEF